MITKYRENIEPKKLGKIIYLIPLALFTRSRLLLTTDYRHNCLSQPTFPTVCTIGPPCECIPHIFEWAATKVQRKMRREFPHACNIYIKWLKYVWSVPMMWTLDDGTTTAPKHGSEENYAQMRIKKKVIEFHVLSVPSPFVQNRNSIHFVCGKCAAIVNGLSAIRCVGGFAHSLKVVARIYVTRAHMDSANVCEWVALLCECECGQECAYMIDTRKRHWMEIY